MEIEKIKIVDWIINQSKIGIITICFLVILYLVNGQRLTALEERKDALNEAKAERDARIKQVTECAEIVRLDSLNNSELFRFFTNYLESN